MSSPTTPPEQPSTTSTKPTTPPMITRCEICEREAKDVRGLGIHIVKKHKISKADYYDKYINVNPDSGKCLTCGAPTKFYEITTGYAKFCSTKCNNTNPELARQRATKRSATLVSDPSIMEKSGIAISQSLKHGVPVNIKTTIRVKHVSPKIKMSLPIYKCAMCDRGFEDLIGLSSHVKQIHLTTIEDYYVSHVDPDSGKCFRCGEKPRFNCMEKGYYKFCSLKCKSNDPDIIARSSAARLETYKKDPSIAKNAGIKRAKTFKENPHIKEQAIKKFKETLANDPSIMIERDSKLSISLREYYSNIKRNPSEAFCNIYLVAHDPLGIVKIGIAVDMNRRVQQIKRSLGLIEQIKIVNATYSEVVALETEMHRRFKEHCQVQPKGVSGRTEWFDKCIEASALKMLEEFEASIQE